MSDDTSLDDLLTQMKDQMGALNDKMGIRVSEISPERIVGTMPVEGNTQPYGLLHGGASVVFAETLGSMGSAMHGFPDRLAVGVDITVAPPATASVHSPRRSAFAAAGSGVTIPSSSPGRTCRSRSVSSACVTPRSRTSPRTGDGSGDEPGDTR